MMFSCLFSITQKHLITENEKTFPLSRQISFLKQSGDHFQIESFNTADLLLIKDIIF